MRTSLTIVFFVSTLMMSGQQTNEWIRLINNPKYDIDRLRIEDYKADYYRYDFSTLMIPRYDFLGYIGSNFRRIRITFTSITKSSSNIGTYLVKGISLVDNNKCDFSGVIAMDQIREYKTMHFGADDKYKDQGIQKQGVLIGKYEFKENPAQLESGIFAGVMTLYWYLDRRGIICYDDLEFMCFDRYCNNQYVGIWLKYGTDKGKVCNWGELRIPFHGDLDIGAAEFFPNPKYLKMGWDNFKMIW